MSAADRDHELISLSDIAFTPSEDKRLTWSFIRSVSEEITITIFSHVSIEANTVGKAWNTTGYP